MRVFFDTNVFFSALLFKQGVCSKLINDLCLDSRFELVLSEYVVKELEKNIAKYIDNPSNSIQEFFAEMPLQKFFVPTPDKPANYPIRDPDDAWVLASALDGKADVLVTGDKDLLELKGKVSEVKIMSPREFIDQINPPESA